MRRRGSIGESWWSRRFIEPLESTADSGRLSRGRTYARGGAVLSIEVAPGMATAEVRGSRPRPYTVRVRFRHFDDDLWAVVCASLARQALYRSALLAGEMPPEIEGVFEELGAPLFPEHFDDLRTECSCPDWGDPCKHIAAVLYSLADAFDDDPFLILAWLGRDRDALLAEVREHSPGGSEMDPDEHGLAVRVAPLTERVDDFWDTGAPPRFVPSATSVNPLTHLETDTPGLTRGLEAMYEALAGDGGPGADADAAEPAGRGGHGGRGRRDHH